MFDEKKIHPSTSTNLTRKYHFSKKMTLNFQSSLQYPSLPPTDPLSSLLNWTSAAGTTCGEKNFPHSTQFLLIWPLNKELVTPYYLLADLFQRYFVFCLKDGTSFIIIQFWNSHCFCLQASREKVREFQNWLVIKLVPSFKLRIRHLWNKSASK